MKNKLTTEEFVIKAKNIHGDKYDYSNVVYENSKTNVKIICLIHGVFEQTPNNHLSGKGCPKCADIKNKLTTEEFVIKAKNIHGDKYDYSLVDYKNNQTKVKIICPIHGEFEQQPSNHLCGKGCPNCGGNEKLSTEEFIIKAKVVHSDKYDYSLVDYKNNQTKVKIICPIHIVFEQTPNNHLSGAGCPKCADTKNKLTTEDFIFTAKDIHGDKYNYSLVDYKNSTTKVKIICADHGEFEQTPNSHLQGKGCPNCGGKQKSNTDDFIFKSKDVHGDKYDYSLVDYKGAKINVKIICPIHGVFEQTPGSHLSGAGCPKCAIDSIKLTTEDFIFNAKVVHFDMYDYSNVVYENNITKVKIICPIHGVFEQTPNNHLCGAGCPKCNSSKGEIIINNYLKQNNISYVSEKKFKDCKNINALPFDFYLHDYNICIEFDGEQHFRPIKRFGGEKCFEKVQINDNIKTKYCEDSGIKLIRISYLEKDNIEEILNRELGF